MQPALPSASFHRDLRSALRPTRACPSHPPSKPSRDSEQNDSERETTGLKQKVLEAAPAHVRRLVSFVENELLHRSVRDPQDPDAVRPPVHGTRERHRKNGREHSPAEVRQLRNLVERRAINRIGSVQRHFFFPFAACFCASACDFCCASFARASMIASLLGMFSMSSANSAGR